MAGKIDFSAIEFVATYLGIEDLDILMSGLTQIRTYQQLLQDTEHGH